MPNSEDSVEFKTHLLDCIGLFEKVLVSPRFLAPSAGSQANTEVEKLSLKFPDRAGSAATTALQNLTRESKQLLSLSNSESKTMLAAALIEDFTSLIARFKRALGIAPATLEKIGDSPPAGEFQMIKLPKVLEEYSAKTLFIDTRRTKDYQAGHITGALSMSAWEAGLDDKINKLAKERTVEEPIVIYCSDSKECEDSKQVGGRLKARGFAQLMIYCGGFPEWSREKEDLVTKGMEPGMRVGK